MAEQFPDSIGPYRIVGRLGHGGMGEVFLGEKDGVRVAIKRIHSGLAADLDFRGRFAREVDLCRRVNSTTCARFVDADLLAPIPWLATEYIAGPDLQEAIAAGGALELAQAEIVALGLAEALRQIHDTGIVHRDLKPSNVILGVDGPRVIDFGIARAFDQTAFTRTGGMIGSPGWMAPEQLRNGELSEATDVFAWGAIVAYAASGKPPFGETLPETLMYRVLNEEPDLSGVPGRLQVVCQRALDKNPASRPSAEQLVSNLLGSSAASGLSSEVTQRIDRTWWFSSDLTSRFVIPTATRADLNPVCARCGVSVANGFTQCALCRTSSIDDEHGSGAAEFVGVNQLTNPIHASRFGRRRKVIAVCVVLGLVILGASTVVAIRSGPSSGSAATTSMTEADPMVLARAAWPAFAANLSTGRPTEIASVTGTPTVAYALGDGVNDVDKPTELAIYEFKTVWKKAGFRHLDTYVPTATVQQCSPCVNPQGDLRFFSHLDVSFVDVTGDDSPELLVKDQQSHELTYPLRQSLGLWEPVSIGTCTTTCAFNVLKVVDSTHVSDFARWCHPICAEGGTQRTDWVWNKGAEKFDGVKVTYSP